MTQPDEGAEPAASPRAQSAPSPLARSAPSPQGGGEKSAEISIAGVTVVADLALCGISIRLFLLSFVGWDIPDAGEKLRKLFPVMWILDTL